jgi:hypothetical protein
MSSAGDVEQHLHQRAQRIAVGGNQHVLAALSFGAITSRK